jgi:hypothetical protein
LAGLFITSSASPLRAIAMLVMFKFVEPFGSNPAYLEFDDDFELSGGCKIK